MRSRNKNLFAWLTITFGILIISPLVHANLSDDAIGTYAGTLSLTEAMCTPGSKDGTENVSLTLTITKVSTNNFHGDGTVTFPSDGDSDDLGIDITGITSSTFSFHWDLTGINNSFSASGSGSGSISSSGITISGTGVEVGGSTCKISFSGTLAKTSADVVIDPTVTPSNVVMDAVLFNTQMQGTITGIGSHIGGALGGAGLSGGPRITDNQFKIEGATGLNAGDGSTISYGIWGNYSYTAFENDLSSIAFDGNSHSFLGGVDFGIWDNTVLGIALGYDRGDIDTAFNRGNQTSDTYTIAPYFGVILTDILSFDISLGYSSVNVDQFRILPTGTTQITSDPSSDRYFVSMNLNSIIFYNNWIIGGRTGLLRAKNKTESFSESNGVVVTRSSSELGTWSVAGDVAYSFEEYEPFLNMSYQKDFRLTEVAVTSGAQPSNDKDDFLLTTGVRYFGNNVFTGNLEFSKRFDRDDFSEDRISLTIRADF